MRWFLGTKSGELELSGSPLCIVASAILLTAQLSPSRNFLSSSRKSAAFSNSSLSTASCNQCSSLYRRLPSSKSSRQAASSSAKPLSLWPPRARGDIFLIRLDSNRGQNPARGAVRPAIGPAIEIQLQNALKGPLIHSDLNLRDPVPSRYFPHIRLSHCRIITELMRCGNDLPQPQGPQAPLP